MAIVQINSKLVFFAHIPRCGGSAIEEYLAERFGTLGFLDRFHLQVAQEERWSATSPQHITAAAMERLIPTQFFAARFSMVRHPVDRLVSVYLYQRDMENKIPKTQSFGSWLDELPERRLRSPFFYDNHVRPMGNFITRDTEVFRLEEGMGPVIVWLDKLAGNSDGPRRVQRVHTYTQVMTAYAKNPGPRPVVTDLERRKIRTQYAADFERFGYEIEARS